MLQDQASKDRGAAADIRFTVVVPAHNEAAVIGRTLRTLRAGGEDRLAYDLIVVCNGCTDDTAEQARRAAPDAMVVELEQGSKALALNTGLARARAFPIVFLDADISVTAASLAAVADAVGNGGARIASPAADIDSDACDAWVRAYYRLWRRHPYLQEGVGGSGVVALSREAAETLGRFPGVIADDGLLRTMFPAAQQRRVCLDVVGRPVAARVHAPKRVGNLIACESRWRSGDAELRSIDMPAAHHDSAAGRTGLVELWRISGSSSDWLIYCGIKIAGRLLYRFNRLAGRSRLWHRDSSRRAA